MTRDCTIVFFIVFAYFRQPLAYATIFPCNTTLSCGCSIVDANINARIVGGEVAVDHSWGWAVSLRNYFGRHFCGGTILSPYYVLTASHCITDYTLSPSLLSIVIGTNSLNNAEGRKIQVSHIISHPNYNSRTKENDIAILELENPIDFKDINIAKICLPNVSSTEQLRYPIVQKPVVAIGWGDTSYDGNLSNSLQQVTVKITGSKEAKCKISLRNKDVQFCASVNDGRKDTCQGDSGGPLMYYSQHEQVWVLAGITSYGYKCALPDYAGVYTRISVYIEWIRSVVGNDGIVTVAQNKATIYNNMSYFTIFVIFSFVLLTYIHN
ncbi:hypothetical protein I4U23_007214 [Adineta vaga]|nr:hypothetical protein I4U23_007214 [Adineta vaga]